MANIPVSKAVLIVEDDMLVRMMATDVIEDAGYVTFIAGDADEALEFLATNSGIHTVFTDVEMPGSMDGLRLAAIINDRWPSIELIVTSGRVKVDADMMPAGSIFLPKPYMASMLEKALVDVRR